MRWGYALLASRESGIEICGEASSATQALENISEADADLVITDIALEGMSGLELIKRLQTQHPDLPILVISARDEALYAERALRAGASGYLMKSASTEEVMHAINQVTDGEQYVSRAMRSKIQRASRYMDEDDPIVSHLTDRELEMFELLGRGRKRQEIADAMMISPKTVDTYRSRIKAKLSLRSSAALVQQAVSWVQQRETV